MNYYIKNKEAEVSLLGDFTNYFDADNYVKNKSYIWIKPQEAIDEMYAESKMFATKEEQPILCINCGGNKLDLVDLNWSHGKYSHTSKCDGCGEDWKEFFIFDKTNIEKE